MSMLASERAANPQGGPEGLLAVWKRRIESAKRDRQRYEPRWLESQAYAAGHHWLKWDRMSRRLVRPDAEGRTRYTVDVLTQYLQTIKGVMSADGFRPELAFRRDDVESEDFASQANDGLAFGWEVEWAADTKLGRLIDYLEVYGTAALRCRFDKTRGPVIQANAPHLDGKPILEQEKAVQAVVAASTGEGPAVTFADVRGQIVWDALKPFNLLTPPGVEFDDEFPWEIVVRPRSKDQLVQEHGEGVADLKEESLAAVDMLGTRELGGETVGPDPQSGSTPGRLDGHLLEYKCYERPSTKHAKGQTVTIAGDRVLAVVEDLPYRGPDGEPRTGIVYFKFWPTPGRFWGRGLIEPGVQISKMIDKRRSQQDEIIDRGLPKVFVEEGAIPEPPRGLPMEQVTVKAGRLQMGIKPDGGIGPGPWMQQDVEALFGDLERALGIHDVSRGEKPAGVSAYSALALLRENDMTKLGPIISSFKAGVATTVENTVWDMRRYWPPEKQVAIVGEEHLVEAQAFSAAKLPDFFYVKRPEGTTLPRSQAAEIQKIFDLFDRSQGQLGINWLADSLDAGKPLPIPDRPTDDQRDKALHENGLLADGETPEVDYYDPPEVHIPEHRSFQIQAKLSGRPELAELAEQHIQMHLQVAQALAAQQAAMTPPVAPEAAPNGAQAPAPAPAS